MQKNFYPLNHKRKKRKVDPIDELIYKNKLFLEKFPDNEIVREKLEDLEQIRDELNRLSE